MSIEEARKNLFGQISLLGPAMHGATFDPEATAVETKNQTIRCGVAAFELTEAYMASLQESAQAYLAASIANLKSAESHAKAVHDITRSTNIAIWITAIAALLAWISPAIKEIFFPYGWRGLFW